MRYSTAGVRELNQHLSEYLRRVADGETIHVTDRGLPVAVITAVAAGSDDAQAMVDADPVRVTAWQAARQLGFRVVGF